MTKKKKIAVIVPAYNVGKVIHECFDSLFSQTYPDWECFCVDDGSTDNTYEVMRRYAAQDKRFHIFQKQNEGLTKTRNFLLNKIDNTYSYIYHLDSDDYIHPQAFEILVYIQQKTHSDVVETPSQRVYNEKPADYYTKFKPEKISFQVLTDMEAYLLKKTRRTMDSCWVRVPKLYVWNKVKSLRFDERLSYEEDYFYNTLVHSTIKSKTYINTPLTYYRCNPDSLTHKVNYQKYQKACTARIYASYDYFIKGNRVPEKILQAFKADLTFDAYRMIGFKSIRRCKDKQLKQQLFQQAGIIFTDMISKGIIEEKLLPIYPRLLVKTIKNKWYILTQFLMLFK